MRLVQRFFDPVGIGGLLLGGLGLIQNQNAQNAQQQAMGDATALNWDALNWQKSLFKDFSEPALRQLIGLASGYDPIAESRAVTDNASKVAGDAIQTALRQFNVNQAAGGATPGQSSIQGAQQANVMKPIAQQLAAIVADAQGNATAKKAGMWQAVLGQAPAGALGQSYFAAADNLARMASSMPGGNFGPSADILAQALQGLFGGGKMGGKGVGRYGLPNPNGSSGGGQTQIGR